MSSYDKRAAKLLLGSIVQLLSAVSKATPAEGNQLVDNWFYDVSAFNEVINVFLMIKDPKAREESLEYLRNKLTNFDNSVSIPDKRAPLPPMSYKGDKAES